MLKFITKKQRIFVLKHWWTSEKTVRKVNIAFRNEFHTDKIPTRQTIYRLAEKFDETSSIDDAPRSGRPTIINTEENLELVSETYSLNPQIFPSQAYIV